LSSLSWAKQIVVVDSGSTDSTLRILSGDPRITVFSRKFDSHGAQWMFATTQTNLCRDWVLRLDADYVLTGELQNEIAQLDPSAPVSAYSIAFDYAIYGRRLRASLYPAKPVLFRKGCASCLDRGHTEVWNIDGPVLAYARCFWFGLANDLPARVPSVRPGRVFHQKKKEKRQ
jgi:glycosyltransferase involved in cell wall biosynthesis